MFFNAFTFNFFFFFWLCKNIEKRGLIGWVSIMYAKAQGTKLDPLVFNGQKVKVKTPGM